MKIGIIGAGNLGKAIIDSLPPQKHILFVSNSRKSTYKGINVLDDNKFVVNNSDLIILTVKPNIAGRVLDEIKPLLQNKLLISFVAGLDLKYYKSKLGDDAKIIRAMTNIAVKNGKGMTVYVVSENCNVQDLDNANILFNIIGEQIKVNEEQLLDVTTGISGSGIAYAISIINDFIKVAESEGFNKQQSKKIVIQTFKGALSLMKHDNTENVINCIASKGGTTEAGLKKMEEYNIKESINEIIKETVLKCKKLKK